jgi:spermidine synthase
MKPSESVFRSRGTCLKFLLSVAVALLTAELRAVVVFEKFSPYHHVQVVDEAGIRMLSFDGTRETRMSLINPMQGHFEYTEYFHMPWIWNHDIRRVLMIGLGGGSTQRSYQHYYTNVMVDTIELDPVVVEAAKKYFTVKETPQLRIINEDGRVYLNRTTNRYDLILMDAYTTTRYGSSLPPHLTTKEFFQLANAHLTTNGVLAYNVIGQMQGWKADIIGGLYRTLKEVFPQVYSFPASTSMNVVFVATKASTPYNTARIAQEGQALISSRVVLLPTFSDRLRSFMSTPPSAAGSSPVLTDDRAPVEGLMRDTKTIREPGDH